MKQASVFPKVSAKRSCASSPSFPSTPSRSRERNMPVVYHSDVVPEPFKGGATYQTLVGDERGSTPIRVGIQTSPPGYKTPLSLPSLLGDHHGPRRPRRGLAAGRRRPGPARARRYAGAKPQHSTLVSSHRRFAAEDLRHSRIAASYRERT